MDMTNSAMTHVQVARQLEIGPSDAGRPCVALERSWRISEAREEDGDQSREQNRVCEIVAVAAPVHAKTDVEKNWKKRPSSKSSAHLYPRQCPGRKPVELRMQSRKTSTLRRK